MSAAYEVSAQSVARAVAAIKGGPVRKTSAGFEVRCIAHDDHDPSMSVSDSADGQRVLVHCHAGCDQNSLMAALKGHSIRVSAAPVDRSPPVTRLQPRGISYSFNSKKLTRWWAYITLDGEVAGYTARYEGPDGSKDVIPYFNTGPDGWKAGYLKDSDDKRCLYGLHKIDLPGIVWVTEGEKAADSIIERGACAVSSPGGCKSPHRADWTPLVGRDVVIWPDHDDPGTEYAKRVYGQIQKLAKSIRIVDVQALNPSAKGWDAYDWSGSDLTTVKTLTFAEWTAKPGQDAVRSSASESVPMNTISSDSGKMLPSLGNAVEILLKDRDWVGRIRLNEFSETISLDGNPVYDVNSSEVCIAISAKYFAQFKTTTVLEAMQVVAARQSYHPVRDYLESLTWDKIPRLESWLDDAFETGSTPYTRAIGQNFLIGAVARIMRPGCQMDNMLILEGPQGGGKTSAVRILAGDEWYSDSIEQIGTKDFLQSLRGKWFVELGELDAMRSADVTKIKQVITSRIDNYRPSYGRISRDYPRQNVFLGTTNNQEGYLHDATGARRFWPIECASVNLRYLASTRDQLWAEAYSLYKSGVTWHIVPDEETRAVQDDRYEDDVWLSPVHAWLENHRHDEFTTHRILTECLLIEIGRQTRNDQMRVGKILQRVGFERTRARRNGILTYVYRPSYPDCAKSPVVQGGDE